MGRCWDRCLSRSEASAGGEESVGLEEIFSRPMTKQQHKYFSQSHVYHNMLSRPAISVLYHSEPLGRGFVQHVKLDTDNTDSQIEQIFEIHTFKLKCASSKLTADATSIA